VKVWPPDEAYVYF